MQQSKHTQGKSGELETACFSKNCYQRMQQWKLQITNQCYGPEGDQEEIIMIKIDKE